MGWNGKSGVLVLKGSLSRIDDCLTREDAHPVIKSVAAAALLSAILGFVLGDGLVKAASVAVLVSLALCSVLLLIGGLGSLRREADAHRGLVLRYAKAILDRDGLPYRFIKWEESSVIRNSRGDSLDTTTIRAEVTDNGMLFMRLAFGSGWPQPARHRGKVRLRVRKLMIGDRPGVNLERTVQWLEDGKLRLVIHFAEPPRVGEEISVVVECDWPGKSMPLMREGKVDKFTFRFSRPVPYARYQVTLPEGVDATCEPFGFSEHDERVHWGRVTDGQGRTQFYVDGVDVAVHRELGMLLQVG
ncbi:hypothetical protein Amir_5690 [Actinosynnema mirum DSM 43827]|uniref:Uncharacterized protein n=1 Tax=Actinosynnema mirum (strain ATCC 29888 / DSM 43827 / JCM 3225 / NBRC 14064 / NCIMB 13271 / NRRL B-12336 / IMRU 3971 / 101) TaxID=446462 RepID=C6WCB7_ACTMD|nr:hypothetical protein Amir_5690 [Actinosynnema mirum DSM 43827]